VATNLIVGSDGTNTLNGSAAGDLIYGFNPNGPQANVSSITATRVASGLSQPLFAGAAPDDSSRLFIVEKTGLIRILDLSTNQVFATAFLDVSGEISTAGESGLLGLAFDPNYASNGFFYVNLINTSGDTEIRRYQVSGNPNVANPASLTPIISVDQPAATNHKAGWLGFGPDGYLHIPLGDGGSNAASSQDINSLLGKVLRLDVSSDAFPGDATRNYAIPGDNMFVGATGADEIYASGLRNPWRSSFDRGLGDLFIADVGQSTWEEINIGALGANYGWNVYEGPDVLAGGTPSAGTLTGPIHYYGRSVGQSVTGGYVYRGSSEGLHGQYFFADFIASKIFTLQFNGSAWVATERTGQIVPNVGAINNPSSFGEDAFGNLYVVDFGGDVFRLTPVVNSVDQADVLSGLAGDDMIFGGSGADTINGGAGRDTIDGGNDFDVAVYSGNSSSYAITQNPDGSWFVEDLRGGSPDGRDFLRSIEALRFADATLGSANADNYLAGTAGNDTLDGRGGDDGIHALAGNDTITGGTGRDYVDGGAGADVAVFTGNFSDYSLVQNSSGAWIVEDLRGGSPDGSDYLVNVETFRFVDGDVAATNFPITGTNGADNYLAGTAGDDSLDGRGGDDGIHALAGNDTITGGTGRDYVDGGAGADVAVFTGNFSDYSLVQNSSGAWIVEDLRGGSPDGSDYLVNVETFRFVDGDVAATNFPITGTNGADNYLAGTAGDDSLDGRGGDDGIHALAGNDTITGGTGRDYVDGGAGTDIAVFTGNFADYSLVRNSSGAWTVEDLRGGSPDGSDYLVNVESARFGDGDVAFGNLPITGTNGADNYLAGTAGNDTLDGRGGDDGVHALAGNDTIIAGAGRDYVDGGAGADVVVFTGNFSDYSLVQNSSGAWIVEDLRGGSPDGSDYLVNVETARFASGDVLL
jgi:Ca2+-binding RTX toxin-like protein